MNKFYLSVSMYYAHTPSKHNPLKWHLFSEHSLSVAENCRDLGQKINLPNTCHTIGLLHDAGKLKPDFQKKLYDAFYNDIDTSVAHKEVGAFIIHHYSDNQLYKFLSLPILGHHFQIPSKSHIADAYEKTNDGEIIQCQNTINQLFPNFSIDCKDFLNLKFKKQIEMFLYLKMITSILVDSDHKDTSYFYSNQTLQNNYPSIQKLNEVFEDYYKNIINLDTEINKSRYQLYRDSLEAAENNSGFFLLPAPAGSGKTLSSLAFGLKKCLLENKSGIIFVLPYTSIIEQTAQIYSDIFSDFKSVVLEHHSAVIDENKYDSVWRNKTSENWDCPLIVTTVVQMFESLFTNKPGKNKKLHNMVNKVIVLDEAQLLPIIYIKPIMECLKVLVEKFNCTIVISTATPPFLDNGKNWGLQEKPYTIVKDVEKMFETFKRVDFQFYNDKITIEDLSDELSSNNSILCIVNKRRTAQKLLSLIDREHVYHLSTTMFPQHRTKIINEIKYRLKNNLPVILIATSCVECGVDFDFPKVYREINALPSIIQAAGRCNRNGKLSHATTTIFELEGEIVKDSMLISSIAITREILKNDLHNLESLENSKEYFKRLYDIFDKDLDKNGILEDVKYLNFERINDNFKVIEQDTISIVIENEESKNTIEQIVNGQITGMEINRKLSPYTINIYDTDVNSFTVDNSKIENVNLWTGNYDQKIGIELKLDK